MMSLLIHKFPEEIFQVPSYLCHADTQMAAGRDLADKGVILDVYLNGVKYNSVFFWKQFTGVAQNLDLLSPDDSSFY